MVNHFRTLLVNLSYEGDSNEFLNDTFLSLKLPVDLAEMYKLIYADCKTRESKLRLTTCLEHLLKATKQDAIVTSFDKRKTYDLNLLTSDFNIFQISSLTSNTSDYSLLFNGEMEGNDRLISNYQIQQYSNQNKVAIFSIDDGVYVLGKNTYQNIQDALVTLTFTGNLTQSINIGASNLSFRIVGNSGSFTSTGNKKWSFVVNTKASVDLLAIYERVKTSYQTVQNFITSGNNDQTSLNYWNQHYNSMYKLSGLLNLYVNKVNTLWLS